MKYTLEQLRTIREKALRQPVPNTEVDQLALDAIIAHGVIESLLGIIKSGPHPDDAERPDDPQFLEQIGWTIHRDGGGWWAVSPESTNGGPVCQIEFDPNMGCDGWRLVHGDDLLSYQGTRGQLRSLCRGLCIPLKDEVQ